LNKLKFKRVGEKFPTLFITMIKEELMPRSLEKLDKEIMGKFNDWIDDISYELTGIQEYFEIEEDDALDVQTLEYDKLPKIFHTLPTIVRGVCFVIKRIVDNKSYNWKIYVYVAGEEDEIRLEEDVVDIEILWIPNQNDNPINRTRIVSNDFLASGKGMKEALIVEVPEDEINWNYDMVVPIEG